MQMISSLCWMWDLNKLATLEKKMVFQPGELENSRSIETWTLNFKLFKGLSLLVKI